MAELEVRHIVHFAHLPRGRLGDLHPTVAGRATEQPGGAIEHPPPIGGPVVHAFGANQQAGTRVEIAVGGKRHPVIG
jgi:hypothetical protein